MSILYPLELHLRGNGNLELSGLTYRDGFVRMVDCVVPWKYNIYVLINDIDHNNLGYVKNLLSQRVFLYDTDTLRGSTNELRFRVVSRDVSSPAISLSNVSSYFARNHAAERNFVRPRVIDFVGTLYQIEIQTISMMRKAEQFLADNATSLAHIYTVLPYMSDGIRVALDIFAATHKPDAAIELSEAFEMCTWTYIAPDCMPERITERTRFFELLGSMDDALWNDPLSLCVKIYWDIETVARGAGTLPRGVKNDQKLSSVSLLVENGERLHAQTLYLSCGQMDDGAVDAVRVRCHEEIDLLKMFVRSMHTNCLLSRFVFGTRCARRASDLKDVATILVGYNTNGYDFQFILDRCIYHGLWDEVFTILLRHGQTVRSCGSRGRGVFAFTFNDAQISVDMLLFLRARFPLTDYRLKSVLKHFSCDVDKMDFSSTSIRAMYFRDEYAHVEPPKLSDVLLYNEIDCTSLRSLFKRLDYTRYVAVMVRYFHSDVTKATYRGNSSNIPSRLIYEAFRLQREFLPTYRSSMDPLLICPPRKRDHASMSADDFDWYASGSLCSRETDLVRVEDKNYVGGLNWAFSCHAMRPKFMDFDSFYPSVMRHFNIGLDNVRVFRLCELRVAFGACVLHHAMCQKLLRLFEYEPKPPSNLNEIWYEGMEFVDFAHVERLSTTEERRVLVLLSRQRDSIIRRVLSDSVHRRKQLKAKLRICNDQSERILLSCHEQMEKIFSNSIYGSLNFSAGVIYRPSAAASVTLLCRKIFHETLEIARSRSHRRVYLDTDGCILVCTDERDASLRSADINAAQRLDCVNISDELENGVSVTVYGEKKYSVGLSGGGVILKGYEKNAPARVKIVLRTLAVNVHHNLLPLVHRTCGKMTFRLRVLDTTSFFVAFFRALAVCSDTETYSFVMPLNARAEGVGGVRAQFIERVLRDSGFAAGERVQCFYALDEEDPLREYYELYDDETVKNKRPNLLYYARNYLRYALQTVEACKRGELHERELFSAWSLYVRDDSPNAYSVLFDNDTHRDEIDWRAIVEIQMADAP